MTPAEAKAVFLAANPAGLLRGLTVFDVTGLPDDAVQVSGQLDGLSMFSVRVPIPYGPLPLTRPFLLAVIASAQHAIGADLARFETDVGRGFNSGGRGALNTQRGYRAGDGYV
jgi:hypothetical protein